MYPIRSQRPFFLTDTTGKNDPRKRNYSKKPSRVEFFENTIFSYARGQTKTELFENVDVALSVPVETDSLYTRGRVKATC